MAKVRKTEAFTAEREREIQQVSRKNHSPYSLHSCVHLYSLFNQLTSIQVVESVNELAQIMKDLSVLVIDQVREGAHPTP